MQGLAQCFVEVNFMTNKQNYEITEKLTGVQTSIDVLLEVREARFTPVEWGDFCEIRSALIDLKAAVSVVHNALKTP